MKILFLTEFYATSLSADVRGGVEQRSLLVSQSLATNHDVTVIAAREPHTDDNAMVGKVRVLRPGPVFTYQQSTGLFSRLRLVGEMRHQTLKLNPDIVIAENYVAYVAAIFLPRKFWSRCLLTYHDVWIGSWIQNLGLVAGVVGEILERLILRVPWAQYITNSHVTKNKLIAHGVSAHRISVIPTGIVLGRCRAIAPQHFIWPTISCVARLVSYKRIDDLLRAFKLVLKQCREARLIIIGSGPEATRLDRLAKDLRIASNVEWQGFVKDHSQVLSTIKGSTVFCLPSAVEGLGMVTLEAMACGTPYVSSDIPSTREVTNNGQGGLLYSVGNVEELAKKLVMVLTNQSLRQSLSKACLKRIALYDWGSIFQQLIQLLARLWPKVSYSSP